MRLDLPIRKSGKDQSVAEDSHLVGKVPVCCLFRDGNAGAHYEWVGGRCADSRKVKKKVRGEKKEGKAAGRGRG